MNINISYEYFEKYYEYLINQINYINMNSDYSILLGKLFEIEYFWIIPMDENRAKDGLILREEFNDINKKYDILDNNRCSVLEMLIAFDRRISANILEKPKGFWFWLFMENLYLDGFSDTFFPNYWNLNKVEKKVNKWLKRQFDYFGKGGICPLKSTKNDQRNVDFWYQINEFIIENY